MTLWTATGCERKLPVSSTRTWKQRRQRYDAATHRPVCLSVCLSDSVCVCIIVRLICAPLISTSTSYTKWHLANDSPLNCSSTWPLKVFVGNKTVAVTIKTEEKGNEGKIKKSIIAYLNQQFLTSLLFIVSRSKWRKMCYFCFPIEWRFACS